MGSRVLPEKAVLVPEGAKMVYHGQIFDVMQWEQELFDGTVATYEMLRRPDSVDILAVHEGKILLLQDEQPNRGTIASLPGGRVEASDSSWEAAAKRELREETGFTAGSWKLIDVQQPLRKIEWFVPIFLATSLQKTSDQQLEAGERIKVQELTFSEFRDKVFDKHTTELNYLRPLLDDMRELSDLEGAVSFKAQQ